MKSNKRAVAPPSISLALYAQSFERHMLAGNYSKKTIQLYITTLNTLQSYLNEQGMPLALEALSREHLESFIAARLVKPHHRTGKPISPATVNLEYRALQSFFNWAVEEGEISKSPMEKMKPPKIPDVAPPVLDEAQLKKLLATCFGNEPFERRDQAILRLLIDTGMRVGACAGIRLEDIDWTHNTIFIRTKGKKAFTVAFGRKTAQALDRYVNRARATFTLAEGSDELWIGKLGPMTASGLYQTVRDRAAQAGIEGVHPHIFRHTAAHHFLAAGGNEGDLMRNMGWDSPTMPRRYGRSAATERAHAAAKRLSLSDKL